MQAKPKKNSSTSYQIKSENPLYWRGAIAALKANCIKDWPFLEGWHKAYIIATVEEDITIHNVLNG